MKHLIKKALILLCSFFVVVTATFFLMHAIPGDPFSQDKAIPQEILKAMHEHYGLDQPIFIQYLKYLKGLCQGDLGPSFKYQGRLVQDIIRDGFPISGYLGLQALVIALVGGLGLGSLAAFYHGKWQDHVTIVMAILGISIPSFILATYLQYLFAMKLGWLPVARWGSFPQTILPSLALSAAPLAFIARLMRSSMIEILAQDYIMTAKAKGLSSFQIFLKHALKNAFLPILSFLGPLAAGILTGSFAIEKIFGIPGLGSWFVQSITNRDYTVIMGTTIFYSALLLLCVFIVDLLYCWIDPRIRYDNDLS